MSKKQVFAFSLLGGSIAGIMVGFITLFGSENYLIWGLALSDGIQTMFIVTTLILVLSKLED